METYGYIYKTTNLLNGKIYIGQKHGTFTPAYLGSGILISGAIKRYGKANFRLEVLAFATTQPMLDGLEMKFIYEYRQVFGKEFLYNIAGGGFGNAAGSKLSEEHKTKIGKALLGHVISNETKIKISKANSGRVVSEESKQAHRVPHKSPGPHSEETKNKISRANKGRKLGPQSKESVKRRIESLVGRKRTEETKTNMRLAWVLRKQKLLETVKET